MLSAALLAIALSMSPSIAPGAVNTCRVIDIALDADAAFVTERFGGDGFAARRYLYGLVAEASAVTTESLDLRLRINDLRLAPFADEAAPSTADSIEELRSRYQTWSRTTRPEPASDLSVLITGQAFASPANARRSDATAVVEGSVCTADRYAVVSGLIGPHGGTDDHRDLIELLRVVAIACGASRTAECDPSDPSPSEPQQGSLLSRCDERPGATANILLRFDDANVAAIWSLLDHVPCALGAAEKGLRATPDLLVMPSASVTLLPLVANDALNNCGPIALVAVDARSARGLPLSVRVDDEGVMTAVVTVPRGFTGSDRFRYRASDPDGTTIEGSVELLARSTDLTGDGRCDANDLASLIADWGSPRSAADLNGDGVVDGPDLRLVLDGWDERMRLMPAR